jgi:hypothetical protein
MKRHQAITAAQLGLATATLCYAIAANREAQGTACLLMSAVAILAQIAATRRGNPTPGGFTAAVFSEAGTMAVIWAAGTWTLPAFRAVALLVQLTLTGSNLPQENHKP